MVMTSKKKTVVKKVASDNAPITHSTIETEESKASKLIEKYEELNAALHVTIIDISQELQEANDANANLIARQVELDKSSAELRKTIAEYSENIRVTTVVLKNASKRVEALEEILKDTRESRNELSEKVARNQMRLQKVTIFKNLPFWKKVRVILSTKRLDMYLT
jgi:chromosome segregation ATPase